MWTEENNALKASFKFKNFRQAFAFMTEIAMHAEKMDHHPEWFNVYNKIDVTLRTHDAGNTVTDKDRKLAEKMEQVYHRYHQ